MSIGVYPPGPKVSRLDGFKLATRRRYILKFLMNVAGEYGDIAHFQIGSSRVFVLNHPDYIKDALVRYYESFAKRRPQDPETRRFLGRGLLTSEGEFHRRRRQLIQPLFQKQQFSKHEAVIMEAGVAVRDSWRHGQQLDIMREMKGLTRQIISKMLFDGSTAAEVDEVSELLALVLSQFSPFGSTLGALVAKLPMSRARRAHKAQWALNGIVSGLIAKHRESNRTHNDILSVLISAQDEPVRGQQSDDRLIHDEVTTLYLAGHETTGTALGWTCYLLAKDQAVQAKLHAELDTVLGSRLPELADVPHLRYVKMVFAEALRIYPPIWVLGRYLVKAFETGGYLLPAGSVVVISQYLMHHDRRFFPEPWRFDPERWTPEAKATRPQFSYFPFGGGPRGCVGEGLSWITGPLLIAAMAQRWRMHLVQSKPIELQPRLTLQPKGKIFIRLERRDVDASQLTKTHSHALVSNWSRQGCPAHE